jgi:hypothetical protein
MRSGKRASTTRPTSSLRGIILADEDAKQMSAKRIWSTRTAFGAHITVQPDADPVRSPLHDVRQHAHAPPYRRNNAKFLFASFEAYFRTSRSHTQHTHRLGGARRDRTDDLMLAKHALSQLSYGPFPETREITFQVPSPSPRHAWVSGGPGRT